MKVLVTGVCGQLGYDVMNRLGELGIDGIGTDVYEYDKRSIFDQNSNAAKMPYIRLDITDSAAVKKVIADLVPDVVIHCAAWTAVDSAQEQSNRDMVYAVNVSGTRNIASACKDIDCKMIYISTDYVFNGKGNEAWYPDCNQFEPLSVYGETKLKGEYEVLEALQKYFIVRIAWVFGVNGNNFVKTMLNVGKKFDTLRVVNDQIGTPTYTGALAKLIVDMAQSDKYGIYHATNEGGYISWYDYACEIFKIAGYDTRVIPVTTEEYGISKAARPLNSRLDKSKLEQNGFERLPHWKESLREYIQLIKE